MKKLLFVCLPGLDHFLRPLLPPLRDIYQVRQLEYRDLQSSKAALDWAEMIWLEWANQPAIEISQLPELTSKPVICRVHSYEVLDGLVSKVNWKAIQQVIFVARHVQDLACRVAPDLATFPLLHHIPNGLNPQDFPLQAHGPGLQLAFVGDLSHKKGLMLLMQAILMLSRQHPGLQLHLAGRPLELRYLTYLDQFLSQHDLHHQVHYHGWVKDLPAWFANKDYLISCSPWESQGMAIMEAMLLGIKPLIHHFVGAEAIYPAGLLWQDLAQLPALLGSGYESETYRNHILQHFEASKLMQKLQAVLDLSLPSSA